MIGENEDISFEDWWDLLDDIEREEYERFEESMSEDD